MIKFKSGDKVVWEDKNYAVQFHQGSIKSVMVVKSQEYDKYEDAYLLIMECGVRAYDFRFKLYEDPQQVNGCGGIGASLVGHACEAYHTDAKDWHPVKIIGQHPVHSAVFACMATSTNNLFWASTFRPLKTQEEIEREEAVAELRKDIMDHDCYIESLDEHLIGKGWRKNK